MGEHSKIVKTRIPGNWGAFGTVATASLSTNLTGTNNDLTYTAKAGAPDYAAGNAVTVRYVVAGNNTALSVSVTGSAITVNVATDGVGAATSTAAQVRTAVLASAPAVALLASVENKTGNDGTGVVTALAATNLAGGQNYVIGTSR
jgi:hypothetical protein